MNIPDTDLPRIVIIGAGFDEGAEARVGGLAFVGVNVVDTHTITARTPTTLPSGEHDVEVINPDGESAYLAGALTVEGGCGCHATAAGPWWLVWPGLVAFIGLRRRTS